MVTSLVVYGCFDDETIKTNLIGKRSCLWITRECTTPNAKVFSLLHFPFLLSS